MKKFFSSLSVLGVLVLIGFVLAFSLKPADHQVLVFSKTEGWRHASIEAGVEAIKKLGAENGFDVDHTEDASWFTQETLDKYDAVIFLNTTLNIFNEAQQEAFERYIRAGGGYVGVHSAADTEYDWPWYGKLVGGWFRSHPNDPNVREGRILVADGTHRSTDMLPDEWLKVDEWYDYKDFNSSVNVLLNVDETSYKKDNEDPFEIPRPIAWYHHYDGGRAFYTGLGHTKESYEEPMFLAHLLGGVRFAIGEGAPLNWANANGMPPENRFTRDILVSNLEEPMEFERLPDGRLLFVERKGDLHLFNPESSELSLVTTVDVNTTFEDGLLGLSLDPNFEENDWIYLYYSKPGDEPIQHLSRFVFKDDQLDYDSEKILLTVGTQRLQCCHAGGSVEFGPNGNLFLSTGDNTNPFASDGFGPFDERVADEACTEDSDPNECDRSPWDAQKSSSNTGDLRGKILRITPQDDGTYAIPDGNLFPKDGSQGRPEIYVMGNRNPFRISIDQRTGYLYWGEVGPDAGEDGATRGPKGHDEVNQAREAGFFGWPYFVGNNKAYHDYDFRTKESGEPFDPMHPINDSPNNTGIRELPPAQPAFIWYPYGPSEEFPLVGEGGRNAMAGPVFYKQDYEDSRNGFPAYFNGKLFTYDWMRGFIMAVTMDENGDYAGMERFLESEKFSNPVDMLFAPDGSMFVMEYGPLWFNGSPEARISHIQYNAGNRSPIAHIEADKVLGGAPLSVHFSSASVDPDGDPLALSWDVGVGNLKPIDEEVSLTYEQSGIYPVTLTVTDPDGLTHSTTTNVMVGNEPPDVKIKIKGNSQFFWADQPVEYSVVVKDAEDGSLGEGIAVERVVLTQDHLAEGSDIVLPAAGHQAALEASQFLVGKNLIAGSDCAACHQDEAESIGPSYKAIANRYITRNRAKPTLVAKIINGGGGEWGDQAMAAHPQLEIEEVEKMVDYIMSLADEGNVAPESLPLSGALDIGDDADGKHILIASYTDNGGGVIGPLTGRDVVQLQAPVLGAYAYDETEVGSRMSVPENAPGGMGGQEIYLGQNRAKATFKQVDLTGIGAVGGMFIVTSQFTDGGFVDVLVDGEVVGTIRTANPDGEFAMRSGKVDLPELSGRHDLAFAFRTESGDDGMVCIATQYTLERR